MSLLQGGEEIPLVPFRTPRRGTAGSVKLQEEWAWKNRKVESYRSASFSDLINIFSDSSMTFSLLRFFMMYSLPSLPYKGGEFLQKGRKVLS